MTDNVLLSADREACSILIVLDLSSAFDTVDHNILLHRLESRVGIKNYALSLLRSYLSNRTFSVSLNNYTSSVAQLSYGVR